MNEGNAASPTITATARTSPLGAVHVPSLHSLVTRARSSTDSFSDVPPLVFFDRTARGPFGRNAAASRTPPPPSGEDEVMPHLIPSARATVSAHGVFPSGYAPPRRSARLATAPPSNRRRRSKRALEPSSQGQPKRGPTKRAMLKKPPPSSASPDAKPKAVPKDSKPSTEGTTCTICMCEPERSEIATIDGCKHIYCFSCISQWSERENTCPLCKVRFGKIKRVHPQRRKRGSTTPVRNTKNVKQRDQRSDIHPGAALEGILAGIISGADPTAHHLSRILFATSSVASANNRRRGVMAARMSSGGVSFSRHPFFAMPEDGDDEDDDEEDILGSFIPDLNGLMMNRLLRTHASRSVPIPSAHRGTGPPHPRLVMEPMHLSFRRSHTRSEAGRAAENPLEIDDDSDDEVQVVDVTPGL